MERWGGNWVEYFYDENGNPTYMLRYDEAVGFPQLNYFVTNLQGDVIAVCDNFHNPRFFYSYDAWGKLLSVTDANGNDVSGADNSASWNILRYRGYVYDRETGLYYVASRYYDPEIGRFINSDGQLNCGILGYNLFAYCSNNPINLEDQTGHLPTWIKSVANWANDIIIQPVKGLFSSKRNNTTFSSSHDDNRRPNMGTPGSTYRAPNGDTRTYGPDGKPQRDYDHDDHNQPGKHPHDKNGGHSHDWDWSNKKKPRGPAYVNDMDVIIGTGIVAVCAVGIVIVAVDDLTGVGVADDFLFAPFGTGIGEGMLLIFG